MEFELVVMEEMVVDHELEDGWIFFLEMIYEIEIILFQEFIEGFNFDLYIYVLGFVIFDGEVFEDIGVWLWGKIGFFCFLSGKLKFKIDFNQFIEDQCFWGLEILVLNNEVVDYSYFKEFLVYVFFEVVGVLVFCTGFVEVMVNGEVYGFYVLVEVFDDCFLWCVYEQLDGNLYDGKYVWYGGWDYIMLDFVLGVDDLYQFEEGIDVGNVDIFGVSNFLYINWQQPNFYESMGLLLNWDEFLYELVVEQWVGQNDGYCLNQNNYWVYFDLSIGKVDIIFWDFDYFFFYDLQWGMDWIYFWGKLCAVCCYDFICVDGWKSVMMDVIVVVEIWDLVGLFDDMQELIEEVAYNDFCCEVNWDWVVEEQDRVWFWLTNWSDEMSQEWGL